MAWDDFVLLATTIVYAIALWLLIAIPAALLLFALLRFVPHRLSDAIAQIWRYRPAPGGATARFKEQCDKANARLELGTVRILLDRKHNRLKRELRDIRSTLDRRLQQITLASRSTGGGSLIDLLAGFKADTERALQFDEIEDNLLDRSAERRSAALRVTALGVIALIVTVVNAGLLYLFFDEMFAGLTIPYLSLELALVVALLFPLLEMGGGIGSEFAKETSDNAGTKLVIYAVVVLMGVALGSLEYMIFYRLLAGMFENQLAFAPDGPGHKMVALVGPALTAAEAMFGFGIARYALRLRELGAVRTIKDHVAAAQRFVNGLEARYDRIEEAAARAAQSVEEFAAQVKGRGEADLPAVTLLAEERAKFLKAVDRVNPGRWKRDIEAAPGDVEAAAGYAWLLPIAAALLATVFTLVFAPAIVGSGLLAASRSMATLLALGAALVALIAGGSLFDRATSAAEHDAHWRDVLSPRDSTFKIVAVLALALLAAAIIWICLSADGWGGLAEAAILIAIITTLAWVSSYLDLMLRGLGYLAAILGHATVWLAHALVWLGGTVLIILLAGVTAAALMVLTIAAWPLTLLRSTFGRSNQQLQPASSLR